MRVWAITCYRAGENSQILALAEGLGLPFEVKRLEYRRFGRLIDVWRGTTLLGIARRRSSPLAPPWPDLVISAAMRNEPVCRWIRERSGGRTRYVHIGKPWASPATFDLVVTVPEYRLPPRPNVVHNTFSLHRVTEARLAEAASIWGPRLAHLPRPYLAVLVGGYSGAYALDRERAERLGREASALARQQGGSLLVTTSSRTSGAAVDALARTINVPHELFRWRSEPSENPYYGFLALADGIVVTCESATMLAEACATRRPVYMFDLSRDGPAAETWSGRIVQRWGRCNFDRMRALLYRRIMLGLAPRRITRDIALVHELLIASGRAVWLGQPFPPGVPRPLDELASTVARATALLRERAGDGAFENGAIRATHGVGDQMAPASTCFQRDRMMALE
jgi:mitochondrial fission protein ELM1